MTDIDEQYVEVCKDNQKLKDRMQTMVNWMNDRCIGHPNINNLTLFDTFSDEYMLNSKDRINPKREWVDKMGIVL